MTHQATIGAGITLPRSWNLQLSAIDRGKAKYPVQSMFMEPRSHPRPAIGAPVKVDANLIGKEFVNTHSRLKRRRLICSGTDFIDSSGAITRLVFLPNQLLTASANFI